MTMKLYPDSDVQAIANAIRAKNGSSDTYSIGEMAPAILAIPAGGADPTDLTQIDSVYNTYIYGEGFASYKVYSADPNYEVTTIGNKQYLIPKRKILLHSFDLTQGVTDLIDGTSVITLNKNVSRDSSGAHFTTNTSYITLPFKHRPWTELHLDISENTLGTLNGHGRLIMLNSSNGICLRNGAKWACYYNNAWTSNGSSVTAPFAGHTLKMITNASQTKFMLDDQDFYPLKNTHNMGETAFITVGASSQAYCNFTVTGIRMYYGFDS